MNMWAIGEVAVLADNIWSLAPLYSMLCSILNWQFYYNYLFLPVCDITEDEDDYVA